MSAIGALLARLGLTPQKPLPGAGSARSSPTSFRQARQDGADLFFWDESGCRAYTVHGKTWGLRGHTPVVQGPGQRQSISAGSAVNAKGAFWFCTDEGALGAVLFIDLLKGLMQGPQRPMHLVVEGLPSHKTALVKQFVASTQGRLGLHFLPGYAPELNPAEWVWSHVKRTGTARRHLRKGEKLSDKIEEQRAKLQQMPQMIRSFFRSVLTPLFPAAE